MPETTTGFIVMYDDEQGLCVPYGWDDDCPGALCSCNVDTHVAVFPTRADARKAILISRKWAELNKAKGVPGNTDFTESAKFIRIRRLKPAP